jgi:hypothetical protein
VGKVDVQRLVRVPYESRHKVGVDSQGHHLDIQKNLVSLALHGISHFNVEVGRSVNNVYRATGSDIKTVPKAAGKSASLPVYCTGDLSGAKSDPVCSNKPS